MNKHIMSKTTAILISLIILLAGTALLMVYLDQMNKAIEGITISNIKQLAAHDLNSIEMETDNSWNSLSGIYLRVRDKRPQTLQELCSCLDTEQTLSIYDEVYLVDDKGNTYSSTNIIMNRADSSLIADMLAGKEKTAENEITGVRAEVERETIAYGVREKPFTVEGVNFIGIFGFAPVKYMEHRMNIKSYDGEGLSIVFDEDGYFIVAIKRSAGMESHDNYYETLQQNYDLSDEEISALMNRISSEREFYEIYSAPGTREQIVYYKYMESTGWVFCTSIPTSVISHEAQPFIVMTVIAVITLIIIITGFFLVIIRFAILSINADAKAKAHEEFLSNMSHELRTPLNAIIGFSELMQKNPGDKEKMKNYLRKSGATARYMLSLINDILDMSKIQAGKVDIVNAPFSLTDVISTLESVTRGQMDEKNITFTVETDINSDSVIGDETHLEQILVNILSNARKFTGEGGRVTFRVHQTTPDAGKVTTVFEVEDNGIGISKEFQKKIFDSFSQERSAIRNSIKGTGLGMSLSYMFAKAMGGNLTVSSKLGEGSLFTLTLPCEISGKACPAVYTPEKPPALPGHPLNILVVEDNDLNAEILTDTLSMIGMTTVRAADGKEAVEIFSASKPYAYDVILMDIQMPVMDGYEATKTIRRLDRPDVATIAIFACSANTFREDREKAYASGMNDFIAKPIDMNKLTSKLGRVNNTTQTL